MKPRSIWLPIAGVLVLLGLFAMLALAVLADRQPSVTANSGAPRSQPTPTVPPKPSLSLTVDSVSRNNPVGATVAGLGADEVVTLWAVISDTIPPLPLVGGRTDHRGGVQSLSFTMPLEAQAGVYAVEARGATSGRTVTATLTLLDQGAWFELTQYAAKPGAVVGLRGGGFQPGEKVAIFVEAPSRADLAQVFADMQGNISYTALKVPAGSSGDISIAVEGSAGTAHLARRFRVLGYEPWLALSSVAIRPSESVDFAVFDLLPGEAVTLLVDGTPVPSQAGFKADGTGALRLDRLYTAKLGDSGTHEIALVRGGAQGKLTATFTVVPYKPRAQLSAYAGRPGTKIAVSGQGFVAGETVHVYLGAGSPRREVSTVQTGKNGDFYGAGSFELPGDSPTGLVPVTLEGETSASPVSLQLVVATLQPSVTLNPGSGPPGTAVRVSGGGFAAGETVDIYLGTATAKAASAVADAEGAFQSAGPLLVQGAPGSTVSILLRGERSDVQATATFSLSPGP